MKKYSIFDIIKYTPKSKDLSPYQIDIDNVKEKVMKNINGEEYVKKSNVNDENTSNTNPIVSVPVEIVKPHNKFGKSLILLCTCFLFVSGGAVVYSNIKNYSNFDTIGKSTNEIPLKLGISDNIVEGKKFLRWLDFPSTADCTFQTFFNDISSSMYQSSFTLSQDDLQYISDTFYNLAHYMTDKDITELSPKYEFNIRYPNANAPTGQEDILFKIYDADQYNNIVIQVYYYDIDIYDKRESIPEDDLFSISIEKYQELISYLEDTLKIDDNLTWDTQNKLFNMFSTPSEAILNTWKDTIMNTYTIHDDTLTELNNSLHYDTWEQLESNPFDYYNVDVPNFYTHDTINFYGQDGKYSITAYDIENYLIIEETLNTGEIVSYYFDTKNDNVYSELQKIAQQLIYKNSFLGSLEYPNNATLSYNIVDDLKGTTLNQDTIELNSEQLQYINELYHEYNWTTKEVYYNSNIDIQYGDVLYEATIEYTIDNQKIKILINGLTDNHIDTYINDKFVNSQYRDNNNKFAYLLQDYIQQNLETSNIDKSFLGLCEMSNNPIVNISKYPNSYITTINMDKTFLNTLNNSLNYANWTLMNNTPNLANLTGTNILSIGCNNYLIATFEKQSFISIQDISQPNSTIFYYDTKDDDVYSMIKNLLPKDNSITQSNENLSQLQLHENEMPVFNNEDELNQFIEKYSFENTTDAHIKIDDSKYIDMSFYVDNLNTLESKSHIYHKMLNSVEYYNTVEGNTTINFQGDVTIVEYQSDVRKIQSYCHTKSNNYDEESFNSNDGDYIYINNIDKTITHENGGIFTGGDLLVPDNYKSVICNCEGEIPEVKQNNFQRNDITGIEYVGSESLLPQNMALSFMRDFNTWDITSTTTYLDRNCIVLEGTTSRKEETFKFWIDIKTGILLKYQMGNGDTLITNNIKIDESLTVKKYSFNEYSTYEEIQ